MAAAAGVLYVVATPIGNLEDLSFRALRTLKEADLIAAEDTRRTLKLLSHYGISKPLVSLREHNEVRESPRLIARLRSGTNIALVSDAGTPGIADPGARLVRAALDAQVVVSPIPGPSAVTAALSVAGFPSKEFTFMGFPPATGSERRDWFERLAREPRTVVFFEAPHRFERSLKDAQESCGERPIQAYKEISKINEQLVEQQTTVIAGEFTVVIGPLKGSESPAMTLEIEQQADFVGRVADLPGFSGEEHARMVSGGLAIPVTSARKLLKKHQIRVKQRSRSTT